MPFDTVSLAGTGWFLIKIGSTIGMSLYVVFAFIVLKQVKIMNQTLEVNFEKPLRTIASVHLVVSILVLVFSLLM